MLPPEGVNPGDFEVDDLNIESYSCVALHHRLEPRRPISSLPLSLLWPRALLRAGPREVFLSTTRGHVRGGSFLRVGLWVLDLLDHVALRTSAHEQRGAL